MKYTFLADIFTYITLHWPCCFFWVRACVCLLLLNTHTEWQNGHEEEEEMIQKWWPSLKNKEEFGFTVLSDFKRPNSRLVFVPSFFLVTYANSLHLNQV